MATAEVHGRTANPEDLLAVLSNGTGWHSNGEGDYYYSNVTCANCTRWHNETMTVDPQQPHNIYRDWEVLLYSRVTVVICVLGVIGNLLNLLVLSMKRLSGRGEFHQLGKSANIGLLALSFSDLMVCSSLIPQVQIDVTEQFSPNWFDVHYTAHGHAFTNIFVLSSTWLIVSMATSRYIVICKPLKAKRFISTKSTKLMTCLVVVVCFLLTLPQFWENEVTAYDVPDIGVIYASHDGYLKHHRTEKLVYTCTHFTIGILVPFLVLIFCNVSLMRSLRRTGLRDPRLPHPWLTRHNFSLRSSGTRLLTLTLVIIVVMYIVFDIPAEIVRFLHEVVASGTEQSGLYNLGVAIFNTLQSVNFAFNFILYCAISSQFRKCMRDIIFCDVLLANDRRRMDRLRRQMSSYNQPSPASPRTHSGLEATKFSFKNTRAYRMTEVMTTSESELEAVGLTGTDPHRHSHHHRTRQLRREEGGDEEEVVPLQFHNGRHVTIPL